MRKIEQEMLNAMDTLPFTGRTEWKKANTSVLKTENSTHVFLHNNEIAELRDNGELIIYHQGWRTPTTKSRLNALLDEYANDYKVYQKDFEWFIGNWQNKYANPVPFEGWVTFQNGQIKEY